MLCSGVIDSRPIVAVFKNRDKNQSCIESAQAIEPVESVKATEPIESTERGSIVVQSKISDMTISLSRPIVSTDSIVPTDNTSIELTGNSRPVPGVLLEFEFTDSMVEPDSSHVVLSSPRDDLHHMTTRNKVGVLVPKEPEMNIVVCCWVYKAKLKFDWSLERLKGSSVVLLEGGENLVYDEDDEHEKEKLRFCKEPAKQKVRRKRKAIGILGGDRIYGRIRRV
ncbi:hypothetical protein NE237_013715 [Protea cynaroides]|uniref:Uncharacterized protein n=1 Tax=Protea cynaroides TaxID=273540 RepID=A0A9Q0GZ49_9MAGN|nr:hypothetical protein NE237_013715 [Protea cynaroides]